MAKQTLRKLGVSFVPCWMAKHALKGVSWQLMSLTPCPLLTTMVTSFTVTMSRSDICILMSHRNTS